MKTRIIKSLMALLAACLAMPTMGQDYLKIYFKDGHTERHFMHLVQNISASKYDKKGTLHSDFQLQQIVMPDTTYSYYLADIDSMAFKKVEEEQVKRDVDKVSNTITPIFEQCSTIEEMEAHIDEIKSMEEVEEVWRSGTDLIVKVRDWYDVIFMYPVVPEEDNSSMARMIKSINSNGIKPHRQRLKEDGTPFKVAIACQMVNDSRFSGQVNYLRALTKKFKDMGFTAVFIPSEEGGNLDPDFYGRRMFEYDIVILDTHGCYDSGLHGFLTDEYLGISTPEITFWNLVDDYLDKNNELYGIEKIRLDMDDTFIGCCWTGYFSSGAFIGVTENYIGKNSPNGFGSGPHIVFNGACSSLNGNGTLERKYDGKKVSGSDAVAQKFFNKGANVYLGYNNSCYNSGYAAYYYFYNMLLGLSHQTALDTIDDGYKDEDTKEAAALIDLFNENSEYSDLRRLFLFKTQTVPQTEQELNNEFNVNGEIILKGLTSVEDKDISTLVYGFMWDTEPNIDEQTNSHKLQSFDIQRSGVEEGQVVFSAVIKPEPGQTIYYRALTYDGIHYNWGEESHFTVYCDLALSKNTITLNVSESAMVEITSGSGSYTAISFDPSVASAEISGNSVVITAKSSGSTYITVKDTQTNQSATIVVTVTGGDNPSTDAIAVDLGLPSGTKWADRNVGALSPEDFGGYYAWGETEEKDVYNDNTYKYIQNGSYDNLGDDIAGTKYDVAHVKWGKNWVMPSKFQINELFYNCTVVWTTSNGVYGMKLTSKLNGNSIFLPAAGRKRENTLENTNHYCNYWSSTQNSEPSDTRGWYYYFSDNDSGWSLSRRIGHSVRPVVNGSTVAVDLGLPSGTKWADRNVGASSPEDYGGYYAWGETWTKMEDGYYWRTYRYGSETHLTKYCTDSSWGTVDNKTTLDPKDDIAHVKLGGSWTMPTLELVKELVDNCTSECTTVNGVKGRRFIGPNGNSIFLPVAGSLEGNNLTTAGSWGVYWSSTLFESNQTRAWSLYFGYDDIDWPTYVDSYRDDGHTVRPVIVNENAPVVNLVLSQNSVSLNAGETSTVDITSGNGSYTVSSNNSSVATAALSGTTLTIASISAGTATITVTDIQSGQTATIAVMVTGSPTPSGDKVAITVNGVSFNMIKVEAGTFQMGSTSGDSDETPVHQVTLTNNYYIGETEVTQALWKAVMGSNPSIFTGSDRLPVECVSWNDCQTFITKLNELTGKNFRLPTEAEWEFAARGGNASQGYTYSGSNNIGDVAWYTNNSSYNTHEVATKAPNELGIYDMSGNVWEWCQDWYGSYSSEAQTNPTGPTSGSLRVHRGGNCSYDDDNCRVAYRDAYDPSITFNYFLGLRLVF